MYDLSGADEKSTSDKIKEAAFLYFLEQGYEATNLRDISKTAGIKAASIYFYFKSKKELFLTIYEEILILRRKELEKRLQCETETDSLNVLKHVYKWEIEYCLEHFIESRFLFRFRLFPAKEIMPEAGLIYQKNKTHEYELLLPYLDDVNCNKTKNQRSSKVLYNFLKRSESYIQSEILITSVSLTEDEVERNWNGFIQNIQS